MRNERALEQKLVYSLIPQEQEPSRNLDNYIWVDTKISLEDPDETKELKGNYTKKLVSLFQKWKQQNLAFKELFQEEAMGAAHMLEGLLIDTLCDSGQMKKMLSSLNVLMFGASHKQIWMKCRHGLMNWKKTFPKT